MITTQKGTIIAGIDARIVSSRDNPNKIDTTIRRSTDNGVTWEPIQKIISYPGDGLDGSAAIDTSLLQDELTGIIWMLVRSEEHTSELQSRGHLVCRLLLEKKKKKNYIIKINI